MSILGIDTSGENLKNADFAAVRAAGFSFVQLRATDGTWHDPYFARAWAAVKTAGLLRGPYHFWRPTVAAAAQVAQLAACVPDIGPGDFPPELDIEFPGEGRAKTGPPIETCLASMNATADELRARIGAFMTYTSMRVFRDDMQNRVPSKLLLDSPLCLADYVHHTPFTPVPWGDAGFWVHQCAGNVQIDGIKGKVDLLRFHLMGAGEHGGRVAWVQRRLSVLVTQIFDFETTRAVKAFQATHGLDSDGVVGPATFARLAWLQPTC